MEQDSWVWNDWVVEDVSDDAEGDDMSYKHELVLLAGPSGSEFCRIELVKLLQAEQKERGAADSSTPRLAATSSCNSYFSYSLTYQPHTLINLHYTMPFSDGGNSDDEIEGSSPENENEGDTDQVSDDSANDDT